MYVAVIADVIDSRKYAEAKSIQSVLKNLNKMLADKGLGILIPFYCMKGDEIEAVFSINNNFLRALRFLRCALLPMKLRIGAGIGNLDMPFDLPKNPFEINGEAFHLARGALTEIRKFNKAEQNTLLIKNSDEAAGLICRLYSILVSDVKKQQWEAVFAYEDNKNIAAAAELISKRGQSIQRTLERVHYPDITACEEYLLNTVRAKITQKFRAFK